MIFPQKGVRFIAINDGVDSAQGDNDFAPLRNIFNEWLVRDTSKKIKAVKRSKGMSGKPVTSKPVYGYLMDEDENFIIDGEAAPIVKQIYSLFERAERFCHLWNALNSLPEIQGRRVDACIIAGMSFRAVAEAEGVDKSSIRQSVLCGLENMRKYLKKVW